MKLSHRIAKLETERVAEPEVEDQLDWSNTPPADFRWVTETLDAVRGETGKANLRELTDEQLQRLEWLMGRASKEHAIADHSGDCSCYYCKPLPDRSWLHGDVHLRGT